MYFYITLDIFDWDSHWCKISVMLGSLRGTRPVEGVFWMIEYHLNLSASISPAVGECAPRQRSVRMNDDNVPAEI